MRYRELNFQGDEQALLKAMDRADCVLQKEDRFYCLLIHYSVPIKARLPIWAVGDYAKTESGWKIRCRIWPSVKTICSGVVSLLVLWMSFALRSWMGLVVLGVLCVSAVITYQTQWKRSVARFDGLLSNGASVK